MLFGNYALSAGDSRSVKDMDGGGSGSWRDGEESYGMRPYELLVLGKNVM